MSYVTTPNPCNPWCTHKGQFDNLGGYGNYEAMREIYLPEVKKRYIYQPNGCCSGIYNKPHHHHHHRRHHHDRHHRQKCNSCQTISWLKGQTYVEPQN